MLEQQLAERLDDSWLRQIGLLDPSAKHVDTTPIMISAVDVERRANLIMSSLVRTSHTHTHVAASLVSTAKQLAREQTREHLKHALEARLAAAAAEAASALVDIDASVAPALQASKKALETAQKGDIISGTLQRRGSAQRGLRRSRRLRRRCRRRRRCAWTRWAPRCRRNPSAS